MKQLDQRAMRLHVSILGWLFIAVHSIFLLAAGFVFLLLAGIGGATSDAEAARILTIVAIAVASFLSILAMPGLVAGAGLLARQSWARIMAIIVAILGLVNFPVGTAIGIYAIWVLLQDAGTDYFGSWSEKCCEEESELATPPAKPVARQR